MAIVNWLVRQTTRDWRHIRLDAWVDDYRRSFEVTAPHDMSWTAQCLLCEAWNSDPVVGPLAEIKPGLFGWKMRRRASEPAGGYRVAPRGAEQMGYVVTTTDAPASARICASLARALVVALGGLAPDDAVHQVHWRVRATTEHTELDDLIDRCRLTVQQIGES